MHTRPVAATAGALLGFSALVLPIASAEATEHPHGPTVVSHRGASAYAPENTLAAVDEADRLGLTWVENDVQRTRDGELVIIHDTTLARTTDVEERFPDRAPWKVADFTLDEIQTLDAGGWFAPEFTGERVPTLEAYLRTVEHNHQSLLMETKAPELYPGIEAQVMHELRRDGWLDRKHVQQRLVIQSFNADSVKTVHLLRPDVRTGFLGTPAVADLPVFAQFVDEINPSHTTITSAYVAAVHAVPGAHGSPLEMYAWTVNDGPTAVGLAGLGVDGVITNAPDVVQEALEQGSSDAPPATAPTDPAATLGATTAEDSTTTAGQSTVEGAATGGQSTAGVSASPREVAPTAQEAAATAPAGAGV